MKLSTCKLCKASILFAETVNGKAIPLDPKPEKRIVLTVRAFGPGEPDQTVAKVEDTYLPHAATCPERKKAAANG